jgi:hypothetical protein
MKAFIDRVDAALWLIVRRWTIRQLRKLVDIADDRLHATEVRLREELSMRPEGANSTQGLPLPPHAEAKSAEVFAAGATKHEDFQQWEARRSGIAPISKKAARQRREKAHMTAAAFDLRYAR